MRDHPSGSFVELEPNEIVLLTEELISLIEKKRTHDKEEWYARKRVEMTTVGFLWWREERLLTEEEIETLWEVGYIGGWAFDGEKWDLWSQWNGEINSLTSIKEFCKVAKERGNKVNLSREDVNYLFRPYWDSLRIAVENYEN